LPIPLTKAPTPLLLAGRSKKLGKYGREGRDLAELGVGKEGEGILILLVLISWARRQTELIFELKKVKKTIRQMHC
jgi:hypothetical protein